MKPEFRKVDLKTAQNLYFKLVDHIDGNNGRWTNKADNKMSFETFLRFYKLTLI